MKAIECQVLFHINNEFNFKFTVSLHFIKVFCVYILAGYFFEGVINAKCEDG